VESTRLLLCVSCCPTTHPPTPTSPISPPSPPSQSSYPSHPCSLPADCSISQIIKDDYRLPFCNIIILWHQPFSRTGPPPGASDKETNKSASSSLNTFCGNTCVKMSSSIYFDNSLRMARFRTSPKRACIQV
jgi:hypothetical protein